MCFACDYIHANTYVFAFIFQARANAGSLWVPTLHTMQNHSECVIFVAFGSCPVTVVDIERGIGSFLGCMA